MALTKHTMTNDNAGVTSDGGSLLDLSADDAQVYFPKWGIARGKEQIGKLFGDVGGTIKSIVHHFSHFRGPRRL